MKNKLISFIQITTCVLFTFLLITTTVYSDEKNLVIGLTYDIPPYIIDHASYGIELDVIRDVLKYKGYTFKTRQFSYGQLEKVVTKDGLDGAGPVNKKDDGTYYSDYFIAFKNYAFTRKGSDLKINSISDLKGKSIVAWQNAYKDLGPEFESLFSPKASSPDKKYREIADQAKQVEMFWNGEADLIVIDEYIMIWFTNHLDNHTGSVDDLVYHNIFSDKTQFRLSFKKEDIRNDFNEGLKYIRDNGIYQQILDKYLK